MAAPRAPTTAGQLLKRFTQQQTELCPGGIGIRFSDQHRTHARLLLENGETGSHRRPRARRAVGGSGAEAWRGCRQPAPRTHHGGMDDRVAGRGTVASAQRLDPPLWLAYGELRVHPALRNLSIEIDSHLPMPGRLVDHPAKPASAGDRW